MLDTEAATDLIQAMRDLLWAVTGYGDFANDYPEEYAAAKAALAEASKKFSKN
jgi:hypothetical protein